MSCPGTDRTYTFTVGQRVAVIGRSTSWRQNRVEGFDVIFRTYKRYVLTEKGQLKYDATTGELYPFRYSNRDTRIEPATQEHIDKVRAEKVSFTLAAISWASVPTELLLLLDTAFGEQLKAEVKRQKEKR